MKQILPPPNLRLVQKNYSKIQAVPCIQSSSTPNRRFGTSYRRRNRARRAQQRSYAYPRESVPQRSSSTSIATILTLLYSKFILSTGPKGLPDEVCCSFSCGEYAQAYQVLPRRGLWRSHQQRQLLISLCLEPEGLSWARRGPLSPVLSLGRQTAT